MGKFQDLTGQKFNRLTVIERAENDYKNKRIMWLCKCDCGNECIVEANHLRSGHTKSCGCFAREVAFLNGKKSKHNKIHTRLYKIWTGMKTRCLNPKSDHKKYYYDRGIAICDEWLNNFMNFYNWSMKNGYKDNLTIDRIDVNGNYEPDNCRWATIEQQARNKRDVIKIKVNNEYKTLMELSKEYNIGYQTLYYRYKNGNTLIK